MQTLILGYDAFDPAVFERLSGMGKLPHLTRYAEAGGYSRFTVANPPQSEVSWTSIATGLNPGGHGIFDFVHRDPVTYALKVSLLPTKRGLAGIQFVPPFRARTIFEQATRQGFPATVLWWPATFPARPESPVRTIPGLGTPDIQGRLGVGTLFATDADMTRARRKTAAGILEKHGKDRYTGRLNGPARQKRDGVDQSSVKLRIDLTGNRSARLTIGKRTIELAEGVWSPILEVPFRVGRLWSVRALTRVILTEVQPALRMYFLPLQLHPLHSPWRYATPRSFAREAWNACGPFLTLGWQQDTTGLEEGCITDDQFLDLCDSIFKAREAVLMHQLQDFHEGVLASVFDSLDRVQHMFWRGRPDIVESWYVKLDLLLGRIEQRLADLGQTQTKIIVVSDHGFTDFDYKVHLNRWLLERDYLTMTADAEGGSLQDADWSKSLAYAVGLNSIYVNLEGREGQGCVPANQYESLIDKLRAELLSWQGPDGGPVVQRAERQRDAFIGPLVEYGPDIVVGYSPGYRASAETGLGKWEEICLESNGDHWGADHCIDAQVVPGVLFSSQSLHGHPNPSYCDFPALAIGTVPDPSDPALPPSQPVSGEDDEIVEERLRGLGYL